VIHNGRKPYKLTNPYTFYVKEMDGVRTKCQMCHERNFEYLCRDCIWIGLFCAQCFAAYHNTQRKEHLHINMKCSLGLKRIELQKRRQKEFVQNVIEKFAINEIDLFECMYRYDFEGRQVISKYDLGILLRRKGILTAREVLGMQ
jgi:hypothetical protein